MKRLIDIDNRAVAWGMFRLVSSCPFLYYVYLVQANFVHVYFLTPYYEIPQECIFCVLLRVSFKDTSDSKQICSFLV